MTPSEILAAARREIGTPFRHQGRLPGKALDCAGLVIVTAARLGVAYADLTGYSRRPSGRLLESALDSQPGLIRVSEMQSGDIMLMRFNGDPQHLAFYVGFNNAYGADGIIHAMFNTGRQNSKVCEHILNDEWRVRIVGVYRFRGVEQ